LRGWDAFVFEKLDPIKIFKNYYFTKTKTLALAKKKVLQRKALLAIGLKGGETFVLDKKRLKGRQMVEALSLAVGLLDNYLRKEGLKVVYVDNSRTLKTFGRSRAKSVILRPQFSKKEVLESALSKRLLPSKSTRHLII